MASGFIFRDPDTGAKTNATVNTTLDHYAPPNRPVGFVLINASGEDYHYIHEAELENDYIEAQPWRGANNIPCGFVGTLASAGTTTIVVHTPLATPAFKAAAPLLLAQNHDVADGIAAGTSEWNIVSAATVSISGTTTYTGYVWTLTLQKTTTIDALERYLAIQPQVGSIRMTAMGVGKDGSRQYGLRPQAEIMDAPTISAATATTTTITLSLTTPKVNLKYAQFIKVYAFTSAAEAQKGIKPNQKHDGTIVPVYALPSTTVSSSAIATYGGGASCGGGALVTGTTYYFRAVMCSDNTDWPEIISEPSEIYYKATL